MSNPSPESAPARLWLVACACPAERPGNYGVTVLISREEAEDAIERDGFTCDDCGRKMRVAEYGRK